jgi:hypothetical protein
LGLLEARAVRRRRHPTSLRGIISRPPNKAMKWSMISGIERVAVL